MLTSWLFIIFVGNIFPVIRGEFTVNGRIDIAQQKETPIRDDTSFNSLKSQKYEVGDRVDFTFTLNFTGTQDLTSIDLFISGSSMRFMWTLPNGGIYVEMQSEVMAGDATVNQMEQEISPSEDRSIGMIQLRNNRVPLKSASGRFVMKIQDLMNIHSILRVQPSIGESSTIYSRPILAFVPSFNVSQNYPATIGMKEKSSFHVNLTLPLSSFNTAYAKLYMPYNEDHHEAKMTVVNFAISGISGVDVGLIDMMQGRLNAGITRFSQSLTSEEDTAIIRFPPFNSTEGNTDIATLVLSCQGALQDFKGFSAGQEVEMGIGFKVNESFIWISGTNVTINTAFRIPERPLLNSDLMELTRTLRNGILNFKMKLTLVHENHSNGTAYDIAVALYLPPTVTYVTSSKRYIDVVKKANQIEDGRTLYFELPRVSFPHVSRIAFNMTIDTTTDLYESSKALQVMYQVIYNSWRNDEEFSNSVQIFEFDIDRNSGDNTGYVAGLECPCPWDEDDKTCACCKKGGCQCGRQNPYKCVSCDNLYLCVDTINGYYEGSTLQDFNGTTFICDDRTTMRHGRASASCMAKFDSGEERVLSPFVSLVLGLDFDNNLLYGISNNGQGYVISSDLGDNWYSIPDSIYFTTIKSDTFLNATI